MMPGFAPPASHLRVASPSPLVNVIRGASLDPMILGGANKESELARVALPGTCLDQARLGPAMRFRGTVPKDGFMIT